MATVNISSIMAKVKDYAKSKEGKRRMREYIDWCIENNHPLASGDKLVTKDKMEFLAGKMIEILKATATASGLPASVLEHFDSLSSSTPAIDGRGVYRVDIFFTDDLSRPSLSAVKYNSQTGKYEKTGATIGEGVYNIVSLFDTGYMVTKNRNAFGFWEKENVLTTILPEREALYFMERAVETFNRMYGSEFKVDAQVHGGSKYYSGFTLN